jgi:antitoxin VapB
MSAVATRRVRFVRNRYNQMLRIPREFELPGEEAILRKEGNRLIVEPASSGSLAELMLSWTESIDEEFPEIADLPADAVEL